MLGDDDRPHLVGRSQQLGRRRQITAPRHDHACRVAALTEPDRKLGVVAPHRAGAHHHRIGRGAQLVHGPPAVGAADPARVAAGRRDLAVERDGGLVGDQRQTGVVILEERRVLLARPASPTLHLEVDGRAAVTQARQAAAVDQRVGVAQRDHGPPYPSRDERVGAGRRLARVAAGFKRAVERGAGGTVSRLCKRHRLGMGFPGAQVPAATDDLRAAHEHGADKRVGMRAAATSLGKLERFFHEDLVVQQKTPEPGSRADDAEASPHASLIRTVTVGPGISPGQPLEEARGL